MLDRSVLSYLSEEAPTFSANSIVGAPAHIAVSIGIREAQILVLHFACLTVSLGRFLRPTLACLCYIGDKATEWVIRRGGSSDQHCNWSMAKQAQTEACASSGRVE